MKLQTLSRKYKLQFFSGWDMKIFLIMFTVKIANCATLKLIIVFKKKKTLSFFKKVKVQVTYLHNILTIHTMDKRLISRIYNTIHISINNK